MKAVQARAGYLCIAMLLFKAGFWERGASFKPTGHCFGIILGPWGAIGGTGAVCLQISHPGLCKQGPWSSADSGWMAS